MKHSTAAIVVTVALVYGFASFAQAQDLQVGTWSGTMRNSTEALGSARIRSVSIVIKKVPDPHWRWRSTGDLTTATFIIPDGGLQGSFELSSIVLKDGKLSYSFASTSDEQVRCALARQADGSYEGDCTVGNFARHITLSPPTP